MTATTSRELLVSPRASRATAVPMPRFTPEEGKAMLRTTLPSGRTIVRLRGALDAGAAPALRVRLIALLHRSAGLLVLDLSSVSSCDASGLAVLIGTQRRARPLGVLVRLAAPSGPVARALHSTGLDRHLTIYQDLSGALATERDEPARPASTVPPVPAMALATQQFLDPGLAVG